VNRCEYLFGRVANQALGQLTELCGSQRNSRNDIRGLARKGQQEKVVLRGAEHVDGLG
jgi:hypothetical protein